MRRELLCAEKERLWEEFMEKARESFEGMFGRGTLDELVTFRQREDRACEMVDRLWQWMMENQIGVDERDLEEIGGRECPKCKGIGKKHKACEDEKGREVLGKRGKVSYEREGYYCGRCRIVFFPSGPADGTGHGRIQSGRA